MLPYRKQIQRFMEDFCMSKNTRSLRPNLLNERIIFDEFTNSLSSRSECFLTGKNRNNDKHEKICARIKYEKHIRLYSFIKKVRKLAERIRLEYFILVKNRTKNMSCSIFALNIKRLLFKRLLHHNILFVVFKNFSPNVMN